MRDIDKGHAWLVLFATFGAQFLNGALNYSAGVIHIALLDFFKEGIAKTTLVGSIYSNLLCIFGPFASVAITFASCRVSLIIGGLLITAGFASSFLVRNFDVLLVTYGLIAGTGFGFTATTSVVVLGYYFQKYLGVAIGVSTAAAGLGMFACGPMIQVLVDNYGLPGTFLLLGGLSSQFIVFGALMKPSLLETQYKQTKRQNTLKTSYTTEKTCNIDFDIFKSRALWFVWASALFMGLPFFLVLLHLPNYSVTRGSSHENAAFLVALVGLGSTINRVLVGIACGKDGIDPLLLYFGSMSICGVTTIVFPVLFTSYIGQNIYSFVFGLYSGAFTALMNPVCMEVIGLKHLHVAVGGYFFFMGIGGIIGPIVAGLIVDHGGTYETSFYVAGFSFLVSSFCILLSTINSRQSLSESPFYRNETELFIGDDKTITARNADKENKLKLNL